MNEKIQAWIAGTVFFSVFAMIPFMVGAANAPAVGEVLLFDAIAAIAVGLLVSS